MWPPRTAEEWELVLAAGLLVFCALLVAWNWIPPLPWRRPRASRHSLEDAQRGTRRLRPEQYR